MNKYSAQKGSRELADEGVRKFNRPVVLASREQSSGSQQVNLVWLPIDFEVYMA